MVGLLALLGLPGLLSAQSRFLRKVQVGVPAVSMGSVIIFFAKEAKIYEKYRLDAEPVVMSGSGIASRALMAGAVIISPIATPTVMNAVLAGSDMVILAHTMPGVVQRQMVRPGVRRDEDFRGKTVAVTTFGSLADFLVRHLAKLKGMNPDKDTASRRPTRISRARKRPARMLSKLARRSGSISRRTLSIRASSRNWTRVALSKGSTRSKSLL
ncbi:MAG: ABC transporter substrate-binding protein [Chloroflexota bacterium]